MKHRASQNNETTRRPYEEEEENVDASTVIVLTVLSHPDPRRIGERSGLVELGQGRPAVELGRHSPRFSPPGSPWNDRPLNDPYLSRKPWHLLPSDHGLQLLRSESPMELRLDGAIVDEIVCVSAESLELGVTLELSGHIALLLHRVPITLFQAGEAAPLDGEMIGTSAGLMRAKIAVDRVADLKVPVLIRGASGTGKELVAKDVHRRSRRAAAPFVAVDMGVLTPALAAAELFGHVKGAFTGANTARQGFFRAADGGTLFLDEVGEATAEVQGMLLRVLETRQVVPVGSHQPIPVDVRLVAATDSDLEARARRGDFKEPLLHRLAAYVVELPPLCERREDFGRLFVHLARPVLRELGEEDRLDRPADGPPWLPADLIARMARETWTGNVRQLANVVRQLVIDSREEGRLRDNPRLWARLDDPVAQHPSELDDEETPQEPLDPPVYQRRPAEFSDEEVEEAMQACGFEPAAAARHLGIRRPSLYKLVRRHPTLRLASDIQSEELVTVLEQVGGEIADAARVLTVSKRALHRRLTQLGLIAKEDYV